MALKCESLERIGIEDYWKYSIVFGSEIKTLAITEQTTVYSSRATRKVMAIHRAFLQRKYVQIVAQPHSVVQVYLSSLI